MKANKILSEFRSFLIISVGLMIYSFAYTTLLIPAKVMGGGATGVGVIVYYLTGGEAGGGLPVGMTYLLFNAVLLTIAMFVVGPKFGIKTIYAIGFNSVALTMMQKFIPITLLGLQGDPLLSAILGGALAGLGIAICFSQGGSSGGTDIIAMIVNKYRDISLGRVIMMVDVVIIGCSYFVFYELSTIIYGYVTMGVLGYTIDLVMNGNKQSVQIMIFSTKSEEIAQVIIGSSTRGVTLLDGVGAYTKNPQKVAVLVCRKNEANIFYKIIKEVDPHAFITSASVMGVYGKGFEPLRTK
ncbi:Transporter [Mucinivorans hirudinis]|uniref:Transporter n=1 Tax=Mucinivorans hirudinis TaxID=1433126 RepID=A0A060RCK1_9BACT|nr:Transporter [Mucinivorans hirudinis]